jgi:formiminotetrahydrofolate cyclodeaminase
VTGTDASIGELRLREFLDRLGSSAPTPGGGGAAALTAAVAAGLAAMTARLSAAQIADWEPCAQAMDSARAELVGLADDDAAAYAAVLTATRDRSGPGGEQRPDHREALRVASEVPLDVANHAAGIAEVAARLAQTGNPHLLGDARTAMHLARAAATSAAELVAINVDQGRLDPALTMQARAAAVRAERALPDASGLPDGS